MSAPKAQTLQQRFGFMDHDLQKPQHDEMMLWLDQQIDTKIEEWTGLDFEDYMEENKKSLIAQFNFWINETKTKIEGNIDYALSRAKTTFSNPEYYSRSAEKYSEFLTKVTQFELPPLPDIKGYKLEKQWERPILNGNYTIGFVDLVITYSRPSPFLNGKCDYDKEILSVEYYGVEDYSSKFTYFFEVKTEIPSLGELIRQLNMYRQYIPKSEWFVVAPISSLIHAKTLLEQGISIIVYPGGAAISASEFNKK